MSKRRPSTQTVDVPRNTDPHISGGDNIDERDGPEEEDGGEMYVSMMSCGAFKEFPVIEPAVTYWQLNSRPFIFGRDRMDSARKGAKRYLVTSLPRFWDYYIKLPPQSRVFYETICDNVPCNIHMDVEYCRETNKTLDEKEVSHCLMDELSIFLEDNMGIPMDCVRLVDLDSSSDKKFSHHYVVKILGGCAIKNNYHVGAIMRNLQLNTFHRGHTRETSPLWVWGRREENFSDPDEKSFVVDMCIYTVRRQFRLCYSTKKGENRFLVPVGHTSSASVIPSHETFVDTLIQCTEKPSTLYTCNNPDGSEPRSSSHINRHLGEYKPKSKVCPSSGVGHLGSAWYEEKQSVNHRTGAAAHTFQTYESMPRIAKNVISLIESLHATKAYSTCFFTEQMVLRIPVHDKNCSIAGREHSSNHVKYTVRFRDGTYKKSCQDPDCDGKYMWIRDLPDEIRSEVRKYALDIACGRLVDMKAFWG